jgi:hypothetical protein
MLHTHIEDDGAQLRCVIFFRANERVFAGMIVIDISVLIYT